MNATRRGTGRTLTPMLVAMVAAMALLATFQSPAQAQTTVVDDYVPVDNFYGTFDRSPTLMMFAGGAVEDFCFETTAKAAARIFSHDNGIVDLSASSPSVPLYLYEAAAPGAPVWLAMICPGIAAGETPPTPFAAGHGTFKARITEYPNGVVDIFNAASGRVTGSDGRTYHVRGWADFILVDGVPQRSPDQFVGFRMTDVTP